MQRSFSELSRQAWQKLLRPRQVHGYRMDKNGLTPLANVTASSAAAKQSLGPSTLGPSTLGAHLPITVRGQVIGYLQANKPAGAEAWSDAEIALLQNLLNQLDVALDSARLYQETRRRAERERLAGEITSRVRASNDPQVILQTAVLELRQALQAQQAQILVQPASPEKAKETDNQSLSNLSLAIPPPQGGSDHDNA
jgi:hypothetical protein